MNQWPDTNESLILRVRDPRDAEAWGRFLAVYRPVVYRLARGRGLQHADAEDLAQAVFLSLAKAIGNWQPQADAPRFRNWLGRVARNAILNALTRVKPDRASGSTSVQDLLDEVPVDDPLADNLLKECRLEAIRWATHEVKQEVSPATWRLFFETAIAGRSAIEVGRQEGRTPGAVYVARYRVTQRIKEKVNEVSEIWSLL